MDAHARRMSLPVQQDYFAVAVGRRTGVFKSWDELYNQVNGFPGARFEEFKSLKSALEYLRKERPQDDATAVYSEIRKRSFSTRDFSMPRTPDIQKSSKRRKTLSKSEELKLSIQKLESEQTIVVNKIRFFENRKDKIAKELLVLRKNLDSASKAERTSKRSLFLTPRKSKKSV